MTDVYEYRLFIIPQAEDVAGHLNAHSREGWNLVSMVAGFIHPSPLAVPHAQPQPAFIMIERQVIGAAPPHPDDVFVLPDEAIRKG